MSFVKFIVVALSVSLVAFLFVSGIKGMHQNELRASVEVDFDKKLKEMGYELPSTSKSAIAVYKPVVVVGNMAYLSGHIPRTIEGVIIKGKVGADSSLEQAQDASRRSALAILASLKQELGTLNRVKRLVKTTGMVNCTADFTDQSKVINGYSELMRDLFGQENGVGARSAVGMSSLPVGSMVEIEAIFELTEE